MRARRGQAGAGSKPQAEMPKEVGCSRSLPHEEIANHEVVQPRREKTRHGFVRGIDDRFDVVVERRIEEHPDARLCAEGFNQRVVPGVGLAAHRLQARTAVDVRHRAERLPPFLPHLQHARHERKPILRRRQLEEVAGRFLEHRRRERPVAFALLDHRVDDVLVGRGPRVGDDAAVAERARAEFRAPLHPADDRAVRQQPRGFREGVCHLPELHEP